MKYKISLCISVLCFFIAFLLILAARTSSQEALARRISPDILRFHVLADSNRREDQERKLEVRGLILDYMEKQLPENIGKKELIKWLENNRTSIESMAEDWLSDHGSEKEVRFELARDYFPTKAYGDMVFPCGVYDTARIVIGSGRGRNWWCVLYPSLCFTDSLHAIVPESSKDTLKNLLTEEDYNALLGPEAYLKGAEGTVGRSGTNQAEGTAAENRAQEKPKIRPRLRLLDILCGISNG